MDIEMENEVSELLEILYNSVVDAWSVPLSKDKCMLQRESTLSLIDEIRAQLPIELSEAKRLLASRDEFVANAKRETEAIRKTAEEQARHLVEEQEITRIAKNRANEIVNNAENRAKELMSVANEYVDDALRRTEEAVAAAQNELRNSRARFRGLATASPDMAARKPEAPIVEELIED
jgi:cell division septum initiation protein DivIVA